jgi:HD-like signal output (HDOD) protein
MNTQVQKALSKSQTVSQIDKVLQLVEDVTRQVADNSLSGPAMPELLQEVRKIITQHNINFADLVKFIRQHQSLALKMLATVNSAYYSRGKKIETIEQAIAALGLKTTYSILQSVATLQYIVGKDPEIQDMIKASLRKAFLVATLSQIVAKYEKFTDLDKAFTVSLFHNLGGTFLLYTYSMLLDKGLVEKVNKGALQTISLKCTPKLNEILSNNIGLPEEIVKMYSSQKSDGLIGTLIQITHKAIFLANRFLEGVEHIAISSEVEIEGIDQGLLDKFNEELPDIKALLQSYV